MQNLSRRKFVQLTGALALGTGSTLSTPVRGGMWSQIFSQPKREVSPITPNDEFYTTSYRTPPFLPIEQWTLSIHGLVDRPLTLSYAQLLAYPSVSEYVTLECVGNGVAGEAIGTAKWEGAPLKQLLEQAGVHANSHDVVLRSADGYSDSLRLDHAMRGEVMVAYKMNGVPLPLGHGFPARMIVPGYYGMKHVQWLTHIELTETNYQGYYQKKGWSDDPIVKTMSWITDPQTGDELTTEKSYILKGFAFSGSRGIRSVELSTDGGESWAPALLQPALSPHTWVHWEFLWMPTIPGDHRIVARATDGTGTQQITSDRDPFPNGTTGLQEVIVSVA